MKFAQAHCYCAYRQDSFAIENGGRNSCYRIEKYGLSLFTRVPVSFS